MEAFSFNLCPIWKASMGVIITGGRDFKRLLGSSRGLFVYLSTEYTDIYSEELVCGFLCMNHECRTKCI